MESKKLKFIGNKRSNIKIVFTQNKLKYALKPSKLTQKQPIDARSLGVGVNHSLHTRPGIGLYPVPTGRILKQYAKTHHLLPLSQKNKKILSELPVSLGDILKNPRPSRKRYTHEQMEKMSYDELISKAGKRQMCPFADSDGDGVVNIADCKPLNKHKQDVEFEEYDIRGNTIPPKERFAKEEKFLPIKNAKRTVEVPVKEQEIEYEDAEDQVGWQKGQGQKKASRNITKITKKWKSDNE